MTFTDSRLGGAGYTAPTATDFAFPRNKRGGMVLRVEPDAGGYDGLLPDATLHRTGFPFFVIFAITNGFDVYDNGKANLIGTLAAGEAAEIGLADNSTANGTWTFRKATVPAFIPFLQGTILSGRVREVSGDQDWTDYPVTIAGIDTAAKVATGGMESDGSDIEWRDEFDNILDFELVSGMNTASTTFVVEVPSLHRMGFTKLYMYSGDLILGAGGATISGPHTQPASAQPVFDTLLEEGYTDQTCFAPLLFGVGFNQTPPVDWLGEGTFQGSGGGESGAGIDGSGGSNLIVSGTPINVNYHPGGLRHERVLVDIGQAINATEPPIDSTSNALGDSGDFPGVLGFNNL